MSHMGWLLMIIRVIVIFALFADEVVCKEREELVLAGIFPLTGKGGWLGGVGCLPAALMALDDVNERSQLLPGYKLRLMLNDSECEPGKGIAILYDLLYNEPQKIMMLGPGCSTVTTTIAEAAKMWNLVVMSYGSSSPALSNRDRFTTFFRTHPSANLNNPALIAIFQHYKWKKINIIQEAEEVFVSNVENLESLCKEAKIDIVTRQSFLKDPADAVRNLNRSDARIIVGLFYETSARKVFCEAYKNYLYGRRVVWLIIGWYADTWYMEPDSEVNCTANEMKTALEGHLTTESLIKNLKSPITESGLISEDPKTNIGRLFFGSLLSHPCACCWDRIKPIIVRALKGKTEITRRFRRRAAEVRSNLPTERPWVWIVDRLSIQEYRKYSELLEKDNHAVVNESSLT